MNVLRRICSFVAPVLAVTCVSCQSPRPSAPLAVPAVAPAIAPAADPAAVRAEYNAILSHLDPGGDLMIVANTDDVLEELVDAVRSLAHVLPAKDASGGNPFAQAMDRIPAFLQSSGLYAVDGFGLSVVPRTDGLNDMKAFFYRDPAAAQLPFWQGVIGGAPRRLATLDYLPADTVLVRAGTGDPRQVWKLIRDAVRQVGGPDAAMAFDGVVNGAGKNLGTNLDSVIASLDAEQFFSLQLSSTQSLQLPAAGADADQPALAIPNPSLLIGCAVRDGTLSLAIRHALRQGGLPVICSTNGATELYTVNLPVPLPFPFSPTFAVHRKMLLFGSTAEIVGNAIAAAEKTGEPHLPAAFQKAFEGLPKQNNGFGFIDRRFSDTLAKIQMHYLAQAPGGGAAFQKFLQRQQPGQAAVVFVNEKDGISIRGTTSESGRHVLLSMSVAPVAMLSAIAIPSFMKSRQDSRSSACINNLRLIDHAKQQWALENNKADADTPTFADLAKYFRGGGIPVCREGGTYSIHAVGEAPTCSHPGHALAVPGQMPPTKSFSGKAPTNAGIGSCINHLRQIDHAKQQWALENNKADTDVPTEKDLAKYFKGGHMPVCPQGGKYSTNAVGAAPTCSKPGHALPE